MSAFHYDVSLGLLAGYERDRDAANIAHTPIGLISGLHIEAKHWGLDAKHYLGQSRMLLYEKYGSQLYWGNPFLRSENYLEAKCFVKFFQTKYISDKLALHMHLSQGQLLHEQVYTLTANMDWLIYRKK